MTRLLFHAWRCFVCTMAFALLIAGCCHGLPWRGNGYGDKQETWTKNLRPPADEKQFTGIDAKAREIERSLGVR